MANAPEYSTYYKGETKGGIVFIMELHEKRGFWCLVRFMELRIGFPGIKQFHGPIPWNVLFGWV
ncbi:uncharacterized protein G2W53_027031 [Senna tora]|uniref:Uncharacterized protein n=1 Tax=Senna tora TaxID=362788 RepID=A0A834TIK2_9FABA|nr:uncharacterized protein G2W53_027030 [Senna tora]KAF7821576.1 uncharacterized protein G2W53_027031 [Senna tora]